jgi:hypothetical protein
MLTYKVRVSSVDGIQARLVELLEELCVTGFDMTRMATVINRYADVCRRMLTYADVCWSVGGDLCDRLRYDPHGHCHQQVCLHVC